MNEEVKILLHLHLSYFISYYKNVLKKIMKKCILKKKQEKNPKQYRVSTKGD
jgi:transcriptional regulatory protein LevR